MDLQKKIASLRIQKSRISAKKQELIDGLPHLYGWPFYTWARAYYESRNKINLLTAANQVGKSSTNIRKCINWATNKKLWPELWNRTPTQFWYMYPSKELATIEFETKWVPEFLPRKGYKSHQDFGWTVEYESKSRISVIRFNSGIPIYMKSYKQDATILQASSVDAIFSDEEMPEDLFPEIMARLAATDGYFHMVFTATLGQEYWARAMEPKGAAEALPDAFKQQVSLWDCLVYEDGSPSPWTQERIRKREMLCRNKHDLDVRVNGKFGLSDDMRKYSAYDPSRHYINKKQIPTNWDRYAAVDYGSGGEKNHPAAICFVAVNPEKTLGYVYQGWRGDYVVTTSSDILEKFRLMRGSQVFRLQMYDQQAKDFGTISERQGEMFTKSEKSHDIGEDVINTLFKNDALFIFDNEELTKLSSELVALKKITSKTVAKDDLCDAMRYCVTKIPWDFEALAKVSEKSTDLSEEKPRALTAEEYRAWEIAERRGVNISSAKEETSSWDDIDSEASFWNDFGGT